MRFLDVVQREKNRLVPNILRAGRALCTEKAVHRTGSCCMWPAPRHQLPNRMPATGGVGIEREDNTAMWIGWIECDLLLGDVHSLKEKRSVLRPVLAEVRRLFDVSVAEVDLQELHRRATVGAGLVSANRAHLVEVLDAVENHLAYRPGIDLLSTRRRMVTGDD